MSYVCCSFVTLLTFFEEEAMEFSRKQGVYPFKDIKLSRADIEWLLAMHEGGRGPVEWSDERQRELRYLHRKD